MPSVLLADSNGSVVEVPSEQASGLTMAGYSPASPAQVLDFRTKQDAEARVGGPVGQVLAGGAGALRALTFGGSDWAIEKVGEAAGMTPEESQASLRELKEVNPGASGLGTAIGVTLPLLLSGGLSAPASGAAAARAGAAGLARFTAPVLAARAGKAVTGAIEAALPGATTLAGRVAQRAMSLGAGSAVEGAFYGLGEVNSEAALGDPHLTWQSAVSTVGLSTLLGGGLGGSIGALEVAVPAALAGASKATASLFRRGKEAYAEFVGKVNPDMPASFILEHSTEIAAMEKAAPGIADAIARSSPKTAEWMVANRTAVEEFERSFPGIGKILARETPEAAADLLSRRADLITRGSEMAKIKALQAESVSRTYRQVEDALRETNGAARPDEILRLGGEADLPALRKRFLALHDEVAAASEAAAKEEALFAPGTALRLKKLRASMWEVYKDARATPEEMFAGFKRAQSGLKKMAKYGALPATDETVSLSRGLYDRFRQALEDPTLWGETAAGRTTAYHAAESAYFTARSRLQKALMEKDAAGATAKWVVSPTRVETWINGAEKGRGLRTFERYQSYLRASEDLAKQMEATGNARASALVQELRDASALTDRIQRNAVMTQRIKQATTPGIMGSGPAISPEASILGSAASAVMPGAVTSAARGLFRSVANPAKTVTVLAAFERMAQRTANALDRGTSAVLRGAEAVSHLGQAEIASVARTLSEDTSVAAHDRRVADVQRLSGDPQQLYQAILAQNGDWDEDAPETAQAAAMTTARAYAFLASKMPRFDKRGPLGHKWAPSHSERARFAMYYSAVQKPASILKHASSGTLTRAQVEAVATVYPELMASIRERLITKMATRGTRVAPQARIALSMLLGQDVDGRIGALARNQQSHAAPSQKQADTVRPTAGGMQKLNMSERLLTPQQASAARR